MKFISQILLSIVLCLTPAFAQTNIVAEYEKLLESLKDTSEKVKSCGEKLKKSPEYVRAEKEIFPSDLNPNKYAILGSQSNLNADQRKFVVKFLQLQSKCRQVKLEGEKETPLAGSLRAYYTKSDGIYGKLLRGELSIGQTNSELQLAGEEYLTHRKRILKELQITAQKIIDDEERAEEAKFAATRLAAERAAISQSATARQDAERSSNNSALIQMLMMQQKQQNVEDAADRRNQQLIESLQPRPTTTECIRDGWGTLRCKTR
jgi:hypothetical protein